MKVVWLQAALSDLQALRCYTAQDNVTVANRMSRRKLDVVKVLSDQPGIGRSGRVLATRELMVSGMPYLYNPLSR